MGGEEMASGGGNAEKILVSVRVRPLNEKEMTRNDICDWECINNTTIICKNNFPERSLFPSAYSYDRVFGFESPTKHVYEEGAKEVVLCVLTGINSSIFAYGQTSSGKTYTMSGITEFAMDDIYDYIEKHKEREFILRFSAIEIYNEAVRDLLSGDNTPLRLLDDPERGTVVEKLREETLKDRSHLEELLSICETQRKIGETSLNETSSRSHQILRLTIESSGREFSPENASTLAASVCFVDLAGSERASQTLSAGTRLKEGCHINRSLLTLGTVIRKLSKGKNGHIPYRDSKLTRILQNSLGGNARTAIICTMSPARSHVEQSRNTLLFASCAKEVTTNAQVNLVVSEKALVKQLQRELARMEKELKNIGSGSASSGFYSMLKQKEELIEKMGQQIKELTWQRDLAQSRVANLLKTGSEDRSLRMDENSVTSSMDIDNPFLLEAYLRRRSNDSRGFGEPSNLRKTNDLDLLENSEDDYFLLDDSTPQFSSHDLGGKDWEEIAQRTNQEPNNVCKDVRCVKMDGREITGQLESEETRESQDVTVDKKAISEVLSPRKEENLSGTPSREYKEHEKSSMQDVKHAEDGEMKSSTHAEIEDDAKISLRKTDAESSPNELEGNEQTLKVLDKDQHFSVDAHETQQSMEKEDDELIVFAEQPMKYSEKKTEELGSFEEQSEQYSKKEVGKLKTFSVEHTELSSLSKKKQSPETMELELATGGKYEQNESPFDQRETKVTLTDHIDNSTYETLTKKMKEMQKTIEYLMSMHASEQQQSPSFEAEYVSPAHEKLKRSRSCKEILLNARSPLWIENSDHKKRAKESAWRLMELKEVDSVRRALSKTFNTSSVSFDTESTISSASIDAENGSGFHEFVAGLKEIAKQHQSVGSTHENTQDVNAENLDDSTFDQTKRNDTDDSEEEAEANETVKNTRVGKVEAMAKEQNSSEPSEFERQQKQIIELWEVCNVPLVHRTYFFLLFKGDPSDFVYMEVELRRLSFLKESLSHESDTSRRQRVKALTREKEWLAKQIPKKFTKSEKEQVYRKWGIELNTKQRSLQVAHRLWTESKEMEHVKESASLVANLVGFVEPNQTPKEMFGLTLSTRTVHMKSSGWRFTKSFSGLSLN
ncbi:PREDICTED: kinesin-like protein KIN-7I [Tarenaya hassleriana]|uniref:kinesin-like protein KIN-7I n=1 Tax=Tarenaya hassleriana TaxID=28532 RepID=UPI00053C597B|nr:PREDICTED: kinesin-like protein KIN-7I [Tarenaya hassleriana]XP_010535300.1 PREDICTED: kinesin-like protein KIN-7I [Tarenaya hassleriana]